MKSWKKAVLCLGLGLATAVAAGADEKQVKRTGTKARNFEVRMTKNKKFDPKDIEIQVGDTITWINESALSHTATPDTAGDFPEQQLDAGTFSDRIAFPKAGMIPYHCVPHAPMGMKGTIKVSAGP